MKNGPGTTKLGWTMGMAGGLQDSLRSCAWQVPVLSPELTHEPHCCLRGNAVPCCHRLGHGSAAFALGLGDNGPFNGVSHGKRKLMWYPLLQSISDGNDVTPRAFGGPPAACVRCISCIARAVYSSQKPSKGPLQENIGWLSQSSPTMSFAISRHLCHRRSPTSTSCVQLVL